MYNWQSKEGGEAFQHLLDTFSGANTDFAAFMFMMREMDKRAATGDMAAYEIIKIMVGFSRLVKVARKNQTRATDT